MKEVYDKETASAARVRLVEALVATGAGDRAAFRLLYELTSAKLFGICFRICGERQAAEDVLHEVYIIIWKRAAGFTPGRASPISWLATIARNRAIDWRRSSSARPTAPIDAVPDIPDDTPDQRETMLRDEAASRLMECLDELEARQRASIRTAFFDGVTYAELAVREGVPLGTMKSWIRRGLLQLRGCVDGA